MPWKFAPYFFTKEEITHPLIINQQQVQAHNGAFCKNIVSIPRDVRIIRDDLPNVEFFEADILFVKRFIIDNNINLGTEKLTKLYFDLECFSETDRMSDANKDPIKCIACMNEKEEVMYFKEATERETILKFFEYAKQYSLMLGWFCGIPRSPQPGFDVPYLEKRCHILGLNQQWRNFCLQVQFGDLLKMYKATRIAIYSIGSYRLSDVAEKEVGMKKLSKQALYDDDDQKLKEYTIRDVEMTLRVDKKLQLSELYDNFAILGNVFYNSAQYYSHIIDNLVLKASLVGVNGKRYIHRNKVVVTAEVYKSRRNKIKGAYVATLEAGRHVNVVNIDFAGFYPSLIRTLNLSFDTKDENGTIISPGNGIKLRAYRGIYPKLIDNFLKLRSQYKRERRKFQEGSKDWQVFNCLQESTKYCTNAAYGNLQYIGSRFRDSQLAEAITLTGQFLIKKTIKLLQQKEYVVVSVDTDGLHYVSKKDTVEEIIQEVNMLLQQLNDEIKQIITQQYNIPNEFYCLELELGTIYDILVLLPETKKRYFGHMCFSKGKKCDLLKIKGIENVRGDTCELTKELQHQLLKMILNNVSENEIKNFLVEQRRLLFSRQLDDKLVISKALSKLPSMYEKNVPLHVQVAEEDTKKHHKQHFMGEKIPFIVVGKTEKGKLRAVHAERNGGKKPDLNYYWKNQIYPSCLRLIVALYPEFGKNIDFENQPLSKFFTPSLPIEQPAKYEQVSKLLVYDYVVCVECDEKHRRPPLQGRCNCGGKLMFCSGGQTSNTISTTDTQL